MSSATQNLSDHSPNDIPSGEGFSIGIVVSRWNDFITTPLAEGCLTTLAKAGVPESQLHLEYVPGSFELPSGAQALLDNKELDAVICLGCVITGETRHDEYINHAVAKGIMHLSLEYGTPVIFGLLTPSTEQQARDRAGGKHGNKGVEAAVTALQMADLHRRKFLEANPPV